MSTGPIIENGTEGLPPHTIADVLDVIVEVAGTDTGKAIADALGVEVSLVEQVAGAAQLRAVKPARALPERLGHTGWDVTSELIYSIGRLDDAAELLLSDNTKPTARQRQLARDAARDVIASLRRVDELERGAK